MATVKEVLLPDIGDFHDVDVIEVLVNPGDRIEADSSLITLESEKATMEVPSPYAGIVEAVKVKVGDKVSQGAPLALLRTEEEARESSSPHPAPVPEPVAPEAATAVSQAPGADLHAEVLVLGAGPGGYTAAFRAADLGRRVVLVERYPVLGGVCLNVGCIPSKALLHVARVIDEASAMKDWGVEYARPSLDAGKLRDWKNGVVGRLTSGLASMAKRREVQVVQGVGQFRSAHLLEVRTNEQTLTVAFDQAIIAAGSHAVQLQGFPNADPRVLDSTSALDLPAIQGELLVIGGGIIGLEMATVYHALGCRVTIAEYSPSLMPGVDEDLVRPLLRRIRSRYAGIFLNTAVRRLEASDDGLTAYFEGDGKAPEQQRFGQVLVAVGRRPNGKRIAAERAGVNVDEHGFIRVDQQQRTNVPHIYAIGDIVGHPFLAHKASHEGKVAAEVVAGQRKTFDARAIPSVAYTDPEVAWTGVTETDAKQRGIAYGKASFPWGASGRSLSMGRDEGMTKILFDEETRRVIGAGIVGVNAGELISECTLAIEMGADAEDLALTIHPHPTLSETVMMTAETFEGTVTDLYVPGAQRRAGREGVR